MEAIVVKLQEYGYAIDENGIYRSGNKGYWSNLTKEENKLLIESLQYHTAKEAMEKNMPQYVDIIFSEKRAAGLELLDLNKGDVCIDYGCMWGNLSIGLAKRGCKVIAVDQTYESLIFLNKRKIEEGLENSICVVQDDIRKTEFNYVADKVIVNGVLEWIPETGDVDLKNFYGKKMKREYDYLNPKEAQRNFLEKVRKGLKDGGELFLAIENRYDYTQFFGKRDPHSNLLFTSFAPRAVANFISKQVLMRPYVNYLYSFPQLKKILQECEFNDVEQYMVYPDYRFPSLVLPYTEKGISAYIRHGAKKKSWKGKAALLVEMVLMKYLKAKFFAPSMIMIAR